MLGKYVGFTKKTKTYVLTMIENSETQVAKTVDVLHFCECLILSRRDTFPGFAQHHSSYVASTYHLAHKDLWVERAAGVVSK